MSGWRDRTSPRQNKVVAGGIIVILFLYLLLLAPYEIFSNDFGKALVTFVTVTMVYLASSFVSKLALSTKLKKYNITHPQLNPKRTGRKTALTVALSLAFGAAAGISEYLSPKTVDYSHFNYAVMVVVTATVPVAAVIRSWFDS